MDMSVTDGPLLRRLLSGRALTAVSHYFFMNVYSLRFDLLLGFLIAGAVAAWVPDAVWSHLFLSGHGIASEAWGSLIGPLVAVVTFVCSVGNVPLAAVLWRGGISFGGVIAFIFADLIILPIVDIYRKYYGRRTARYLFVVSFLTMAAAGLVVGLLFHALGAEPTNRSITGFESYPTWNATTVVNIAALLLMVPLGVRFLRTGGIAMLRAMEGAPDENAEKRDPVCGMTVDPTRAAERVTHGGRTYVFCSAGCRTAFETDPDRYTASTAAPEAPPATPVDR